MDALSLLHAERERAAARIAALTGSVAAIDETTGFASADDEHDPEGTTLSLERSQASALLTDARRSLAEIDAALDRVADGTYGVCEMCGAAVPEGRLEARPSTRTCVACAA